MSVIEAILLGLIQGLAEFLPVSSSGHLLLFQKIFGLNDVPMFFTIMLHIGTLFAVCIALRRELAAIFRKPFGQNDMDDSSGYRSHGDNRRPFQASAWRCL